MVELDTSFIQANHPLENENDESFDEQDIIDDEYNEVMNQIQKLKRYKKYKIRAWIFSADEWFEGTLKVHVLRFVKMDGNDTANNLH